MKVLLAQLCPTLCDPMDSSPSGFSVHGISQVKILEWVAISFSKDLPDQRMEPAFLALAGRFFTNSATREAPISSLLIHLSMDTFFWVLAIVYNAAMNLGVVYIFELWFSPDICTGVGLLDMIALFLVF